MRRRFGSYLVAAAALSAGAAEAGALRVSPVGLDLSSGQSAAVVTLRNDDPAGMNIQVRVYRWSQVDGSDRLDPTQDVVASPPISTLKGQAERVVRIVRVAPPAAQEQSYRVIVDELPPPPGEDTPRVRLLMRHSIPVFFSAGPRGGPRVAWRIRAEGSAVALVASNAGDRRLRVSNVRVQGADGAVVLNHPGLLGYVLAGSEAAWALPAGTRSPPAHLTADTDGGSIDVPLAPGP